MNVLLCSSDDHATKNLLRDSSSTDLLSRNTSQHPSLLSIGSLEQVSSSFVPPQAPIRCQRRLQILQNPYKGMPEQRIKVVGLIDTAKSPLVGFYHNDVMHTEFRTSLQDVHVLIVKMLQLFPRSININLTKARSSGGVGNLHSSRTFLQTIHEKIRVIGLACKASQ
ncbi:hypothetical protein Mapa_008840 [Marchantia paleacea]|nr:hypothetical protein Mapa_008840 [Marchantia paleacea]